MDDDEINKEKFFKTTYGSYIERLPYEHQCRVMQQKLLEGSGKGNDGVNLDYEQTIVPMCLGLMTGRNLMFTGPPGTGKTMAAKILGEKILGREVDRITAHKDLSASDFFGDWDFQKQLLAAQMCRGGGNGIIDESFQGARCNLPNFFTDEFFLPGPALKAVKKGGVLFVDEVNRAGSDFPNLLMELGQEKTITIPSYNDGKPIRYVPKEGDEYASNVKYPLIIVTLNEQESSGTKDLGIAFKRRFMEVPFNNRTGEVLQEVTHANYPGIQKISTEHAKELLEPMLSKRKKGEVV